MAPNLIKLYNIRKYSYVIINFVGLQLICGIYNKEGVFEYDRV